MSFRFRDVKAQILLHLATGQSGSVESIHSRAGERGGLIRVSLPAGGSVVVKTWVAATLKQRIRVLSGTSSARREWRMHRLLYRFGINVPKPLAFRRLNVQTDGTFEVMVFEDLGETKRALVRLKELIAEGKESEVCTFEDRLIDETARLIHLRVVDIDHQLNNFVVDEQDRLTRIDFECARHYPLGLMPRSHYARMLARFLTGHIHAVQPDVSRSIRFADRLYNRVHVTRRIKAMISDVVRQNLSMQFERTGMATTVQLPE